MIILKWWMAVKSYFSPDLAETTSRLEAAILEMAKKSAAEKGIPGIVVVDVSKLTCKECLVLLKAMSSNRLLISVEPTKA